MEGLTSEGLKILSFFEDLRRWLEIKTPETKIRRIIKRGMVFFNREGKCIKSEKN